MRVPLCKHAPLSAVVIFRQLPLFQKRLGPEALHWNGGGKPSFDGGGDLKDEKTQLTTHELWAKLFMAPSIDRFISESGDDCALPMLKDYLVSLCTMRGLSQADVAKRAHIERSYGNRLFSGLRHPSRDTVLQLAFGFGLTTDETQQLLKVARKASLHPKIKRDAVIAYCLHKTMPLMEAQQALYDMGLPLLGGNRNA